MKRSDITWTDYSGGDANFILGCTRASAACPTRLSSARTFPGWVPVTFPGR